MGAEERSARNWLTGLGLDRSERLREQYGADDNGPQSGSFTFAISGRGEVLLETAGQLAQLTLSHVHSERRVQWLFLGLQGGNAVWARIVEDNEREQWCSEQRQFVDLRHAALNLPPSDAGYAAYARALVHWHARHRFCGVCGHPTHPAAAGHRLLCSNADCAAEHFPRLDPAVIVLVEHQGRCLLGRHPRWPPRRFSVLAGFVEPGESLEDALAREVFEEVGVRIGECDYHSSQPWPFPSSLMLGFMARAKDPALQLSEEIVEAGWYTPDELLAAVRAGEIRLSTPLSLSSRLIEDWYLDRGGRHVEELFR